MTKFLGIILASIFSVILIVQVEQVRAQVADTPLTGPITSPITAPMTSPTDSPTPTLINTLTSTPTITDTISPTMTVSLTPTVTPSSSPTMTPAISATPTPLPTNVTRLSGLNLDGYCIAIGNNWDTVVNGDWYCGNGSSKIDMTSACQWQNGRTDTFAFQDMQGNVYSWSCYAATPNITPTPSISAEPTVTPTETMTLTPTPSASATTTPTPSNEATPTEIMTPTVTQSVAHHDNHSGFTFHGISLKAIINAVRMLEDKRNNEKQKEASSIKAEACTNHDNDNKRFITPEVSAHHTVNARKDMKVSMRFK